ncbi:hypothetical protein MK805_10015 [Shimazuella sp. AN120528]|uniref:hypothetical protein n=1 Tax=Shimazuella soli TaxID=1892854 RepID=UPI001F1027E7|nr:hypothetical protein [Shimazuella soli]MCH5585304.1 hypothetical protein [Shimazuella soli]
MQFKQPLAALGTAAVAVSLVAGCSSTPAHYGAVKASRLDATPIADWKSKAVKVRCERDEYAVYKDSGRKIQKCYEPSKTAVMTPVNNWRLTIKYWCGRGKKLSFVPGTGRKLVFCFEGQKKRKATAMPVSTWKATPSWKPSTPGTSNNVNPGTPSKPKTLTPATPSKPKTLTSGGTSTGGSSGGSSSGGSSGSSSSGGTSKGGSSGGSSSSGGMSGGKRK